MIENQTQTSNLDWLLIVNSKASRCYLDVIGRDIFFFFLSFLLVGARIDHLVKFSFIVSAHRKPYRLKSPGSLFGFLLLLKLI